MAAIDELDVVALARDVPERGLRAGEEGTVVQIMAPDVFLVEFADDQGRTTAMATFRGDDLRVVWRATEHQPAGNPGGKSA